MFEIKFFFFSKIHTNLQIFKLLEAQTSPKFEFIRIPSQIQGYRSYIFQSRDFLKKLS